MEFMKESAIRLLDSTGILYHLSRFGTVHIIGSFAFDMMTDPDIDLIVVTDTPRESSEHALDHIARLHLFQKLEYGDFDNFPRANRPRDYILNMRTPFEGQNFEIETWFTRNADDKLAFVEKMKHVTPEQRQQIMELKLDRHAKGIDKYQVPSIDIYNQVLSTT